MCAEFNLIQFATKITHIKNIYFMLSVIYNNDTVEMCVYISNVWIDTEISIHPIPELDTLSWFSNQNIDTLNIFWHKAPVFLLDSHAQLHGLGWKK